MLRSFKREIEKNAKAQEARAQSNLSGIAAFFASLRLGAHRGDGTVPFVTTAAREIPNPVLLATCPIARSGELRKRLDLSADLLLRLSKLVKLLQVEPELGTRSEEVAQT